MTKLVWHETGKKLYETGVSKGVLFVLDPQSGNYKTGVAWNGLTNVTKSPEGAEPQPQYADNVKYLEILSAEEFKGTIEAYTYPDEFSACDGSAEPDPGIEVGQQDRAKFGFAYETLIGNDVAGQNAGKKLHVIYGCLASPSEKAYSTVNDSPEPAAFSWSISATKVAFAGGKPTATLTFNSMKLGADKYKKLTDQIYGSDAADPTLLLPDALIAAIKG